MWRARGVTISKNHWTFERNCSLSGWCGPKLWFGPEININCNMRHLVWNRPVIRIIISYNNCSELLKEQWLAWKTKKKYEITKAALLLEYKIMQMSPTPFTYFQMVAFSVGECTHQTALSLALIGTANRLKLTSSTSNCVSSSINRTRYSVTNSCLFSSTPVHRAIWTGKSVTKYKPAV
jgi:hypothetical protein